MTHNPPSKQNFRDAMASCAAGVHVVTTDGTAGRYGITMTAITAVTDEPPTLILCINKQSRFAPILLENKLLCVNVLNAQQQDVAEHFAGLTKLPPEERFQYHSWHTGKSGQWQLHNALASLHGRITQHWEMGTHFVFTAELDDIQQHPNHESALVYFRRQFSHIEPNQ